MSIFSRYDSYLALNVKRSLASNSLIAGFSVLLDHIISEMNYDNTIMIDRKKAMKITGDKSPSRVKKIMPIMEDLGVWVKIKRSQYMMNPLLVNRNAAPGFYMEYLEKGGKKIIAP